MSFKNNAQRRNHQPIGSKNPYEPEAVIHGQPSSGDQCSVGSKEDENEDEPSKTDPGREKKLAGLPEDQKI